MTQYGRIAELPRVNANKGLNPHLYMRLGSAEVCVPFLSNRLSNLGLAALLMQATRQGGALPSRSQLAGMAPFNSPLRLVTALAPP